MPETIFDRFLIGALSEDAYGSGTDGTNDLTAGDDPNNWLAVIEQDEPPFSENINDIPNQEQTAVHSTKESEKYGHSLGVSFEAPLKGKKSSAGDPPYDAPILKAANHKETINGTTDSRYNLITGDDQTRVPSMAMVMYMFTRSMSDAYRWVAQGVRGDMSYTFEMGESITYSFEGTALFNPFPAQLEVADKANTLPTLPSEYAGEKDTLEVIGITFKIGGTDYEVESFTLETNWSVDEDNVGTKANRTLKEVYLTRGSGSPVGGSITFKGRSDVVTDIFPKTKSGATSSLTVTATNGTDTVEFSFPNIQFGTDAISFADATFDNPYEARGDYGNTSGEDEYEIIYT